MRWAAPCATTRFKQASSCHFRWHENEIIFLEENLNWSIVCHSMTLTVPGRFGAANSSFQLLFPGKRTTCLGTHILSLLSFCTRQM